MQQATQFPAYTYLLSFKDAQGIEHSLGAFAETSAPVKIQGIHKVTDVTMKYGVINSANLANWIGAQRSVKNASALSSLTITERDELRHPVRTWLLNKAMLQKVAAPPLSAKSHNVEVEELVLIGEVIAL